MCRLLGYLSADRHASARRWFLDGPRSLLAQSNAQSTSLQADGWGIAWYEPDGRLAVERGTGGAYEPTERPRFEAAARRARGSVVIGHLRRASNPRRLPREQLVGLENSQPFSDGAVAFAHNGSIPYPVETEPLLGRFVSNVRGVNDSEVLFWLWRRHLDEGSDPVGAYEATIADLVRVWTAKDGKVGTPYSGLNLVVATGPGELWAFCRSLGDRHTALIDRGRPYYEMAYRADRSTIVVGSEPLDDERAAWRSLNDGSFLRATVRGDSVEVKTGSLSASALRTVPVSAA